LGPGGGHHRKQQAGSGQGDEQADQDQDAPELADQAHARGRGQDQAGDHRQQGEGGVAGGVVQAPLQEQGDDVIQAAEGGEEHQARDQAGSEALVGQESRLEQRLGGGDLAPAESGEQDRGGADEGDRDDGPSAGRALDQPVEQAEHRSAEQQRSGQVDAGGGVGIDAGKQADRGDQPGAAQDDVDQEYRAPAEAGDVGVDDEPGQDRAAHGAQAQQGPEGAEGLGQHVLGEGLGHDRYALRDEERAERALGDPRDDEHGRARRQAADGRGDGEPGHAGDEQPALAVLVTQPPAHDQQGAHGQRVSGTEPLHERWPAAQMGHDGGSGDVGDRGIEQVQQVSDQDHAKDGPHQLG